MQIKHKRKRNIREPLIEQQSTHTHTHRGAIGLCIRDKRANSLPGYVRQTAAIFTQIPWAHTVTRKPSSDIGRSGKKKVVPYERTTSPRVRLHYQSSSFLLSVRVHRIVHLVPGESRPAQKGEIVRGKGCTRGCEEIWVARKKHSQSLVRGIAIGMARYMAALFLLSTTEAVLLLFGRL